MTASPAAMEGELHWRLEDLQAREEEFRARLQAQEKEFRAKLQAQEEEFRGAVAALNADLEAQHRCIHVLKAALAAQRAAQQIEAEADAHDDACRCLDAAFATDGNTTFQEARCLPNESGASSVVRAFNLVSAAAGLCEEREAFGQIMPAKRALRNVIVLRCISRSQPGKREVLLVAAGEAFGVDFLGPTHACLWVNDLRSALPLASHKIRDGRPNTDISNNVRGRIQKGVRKSRKRRDRGDGGDKPPLMMGSDAASEVVFWNSSVSAPSSAAPSWIR